MDLESEACEQQTVLELERAAKKQRKVQPDKKRAEPQAEYDAKQRASTRELKEEKEAQKKKNLLKAACKQDLISSDITTKDDEAAQVSNLNAIAMIEYEHCRLEKEVEKEIQAAPNLLFSVSVPTSGTGQIVYHGTSVRKGPRPLVGIAALKRCLRC